MMGRHSRIVEGVVFFYSDLRRAEGGYIPRPFFLLADAHTQVDIFGESCVRKGSGGAAYMV
jgi:hypothetical protein